MGFGGEDLFDVFTGSEQKKRKNDDAAVVIEEKRAKQDEIGKFLNMI